MLTTFEYLSEVLIDILAINETKLDSSISDGEIYMPRFEVKLMGEAGRVCIYL